MFPSVLERFDELFLFSHYISLDCPSYLIACLLVLVVGMILGDHPNCRFGLPVTLEWDYIEYEPLAVNDYEIHHARRRPLRQMMLPSQTRLEMFQALGYSIAELNKARKKLKQIKRQR